MKTKIITWLMIISMIFLASCGSETSRNSPQNLPDIPITDDLQGILSGLKKVSAYCLVGHKGG